MRMHDKTVNVHTARRKHVCHCIPCREPPLPPRPAHRIAPLTVCSAFFCAAPLAPHVLELARILALFQLKTGAGGFVLGTLATVVGFFDGGSADEKEKKRAPVRGDAGTGFRLFGSIFNLRSHASVRARACCPCVRTSNACVPAVGARGTSALLMCQSLVAQRLLCLPHSACKTHKRL